MDFQTLISDMPSKRGSVHTLENGAPMARSYAQLYQDVMTARCRLEEWGVRSGMRVGIHAPNCYQWLVHDFALLDMGAVSVAFTDDFDNRLDEEVLVQYGISLLLICKKAATRFPNRSSHIGFLDAPSPGTHAVPRDFPRYGDEDDHLSLVFSSGSSGGLKGLIVSRKGTCATLPPILEAIGVDARDRLLLFLPMSNFQQRFLCYAALQYDFDLILTDFNSLFEAMRRLHPTILLAPPIFYQMTYGDTIKGFILRRRVRDALACGASLLPSSALRRWIARHLYRGIYHQFGPAIRLLITGMAPIRHEIAQFFARAQLPLCEAYGMVEAGVMAFRPPDCKEYGSVGRPLRDVHFTVEKEGELIVSRPRPLTLRYFQSADGENERTFLSHNRIATGDIGRIDQAGNLFVLGRKGETIVTSSGQKIHPEVVEREINRHPHIESSVIFQRANASHLSCVVSLSSPGTEGLKRSIRKFVSGLQNTKRISPFVEVIFADDPFTRENGMLRPNMKIDRRNVVAHWSKIGQAHQLPANLR